MNQNLDYTHVLSYLLDYTCDREGPQILLFVVKLYLHVFMHLEIVFSKNTHVRLVMLNYSKFAIYHPLTLKKNDI